MNGADGARRAVAYIRLSESRPELARAGADEDAPRAQRLAIEAWAVREHVAITSWQVDLGVSGATPIAERPGLVAAYRAIREHSAGILVAANADRFADDELVCWLIERAALTEGATVHTADGSRRRASTAGVDLPAADAAWTRGAVDLARAYHRVVLRSRIRASLAEKRARGERVGTIPYGYRLSADRRHVEPDEAEQAVVRAVRELSRSGLSQRAIVAQLAARSVTGRTGAPLRQTQVAKILRSAP
jgi:DNA invertase Pin-like site-specific DNA recombinase